MDGTSCLSYTNVSCVTRKCALRSLSLSYRKRDWQVGPANRSLGTTTTIKLLMPSKIIFCGYDNDKDL